MVDDRLRRAIANSNADEVRLCICQGENVNAVDERPVLGNGNTPLHDAVIARCPEIVSLLLDAGADVNAQCDDGWTPLIRACNANDFAIAKILLAAGASIGIPDNEGYRALDRTNSEMLIQLLDKHRRK